MSLFQDVHRHENSKLVNKFSHYYPIYERELSEYRNKSVTILEIGVSQGGSLQMWKRFFGPYSTIIGIDINPRHKKHEKISERIHVRVGDQSDEIFLDGIIKEFGSPDIVIDDGSHLMKDITKSFHYLYPKLSKNGSYIVEDLLTAYLEEFGGGVDNPQNFVNISKDFVDQLYACDAKGSQLIPDFISYNTICINFYNGIIAFKRGKPQPTVHEIVGKPDIIYRLSNFVPKKLIPYAQKIRRLLKV